MSKGIKKEHINLRFNLLTLFVYIAGAILIIQLFNLQIVHGDDYRLQSDTRLTRESTIEAVRGEIWDRSGNVLATISTAYDVELYKTNIEDKELNQGILNLVNVLEKNEEKYSDNFPIKIDPFEFTIKDKTLSDWKEKYKFDSNITAEEAFYKFKDKYKIEFENVSDVRKVIAIRYLITTQGYSSTKSIRIAQNIKTETLAELSERNNEFAGINIITNSTRKYTQGSLASHILGYMGKIDKNTYEANQDIYDPDDVVGKTGIENVFEAYLKGKDGEKQIDMAVDGSTTAEYITKEAVAGSNVVLTIDANLQRVTEEALKNNINKIANGEFSEKIDTQCGSAIVMKVDTGEILAMASYPDFEPQKFVGNISSEDWNNYINDERKPLWNRAIQSSYAPGSIFKMVTSVAGLETGVITLKEKINDTGVYKYSNDYQPKCWYYSYYHRGHGYLDISGAIQHSCNYFFYEVGNRLGIDRLSEYAKKFGLGSKTGVELTGETAGTVASKEAKEKISKSKWQGGETLSASIGQSYNSFTPLQIAKYVAVLVNGGKKVNPTIISTIINADGTEVPKDELKEYTKEKTGVDTREFKTFEIKEEYLSAILEGMRSVTDETGGTAYSTFKDFNITVGGKTGSAQAGGNVVNAWFAGFAPYENPEIVVVVLVEKGEHGTYTAEVAKEIMAEYFGMNSAKVDEKINAIPYIEMTRN